jgi:hypothetical protein
LQKISASRFEHLILDTMTKANMRIYLYKTQKLLVDGGERLYKAPGYFNAPEYLAEKWIGLGLAVPATQDNTHEEPEPVPLVEKHHKRSKGEVLPKKAKPLEQKRAKGEKPQAIRYFEF